MPESCLRLDRSTWRDSTKGRALGLLVALALTACANAPQPISSGHITTQSEPTRASAIPAPVLSSPILPAPRAAARQETYSVVVNNVHVRDLLFALARDAKLNVDIGSDVDGYVTLNAINQTLPQILERIAKQADVRFERDGPNLNVMRDTPFLRTYKINYVNISRDVTANVTVATEIASTGRGAAGTTGNASTGSNSSTAITNTANNRFWQTLTTNIQDLLRETDRVLPEGASQTVTETAGTSSSTTGATANATAAPGAATSTANNSGTATTNGAQVVRRTSNYREAASVIANPEAGVIAVRATGRQHERVQEFLATVLTNAKRQVLIEATVLEVQLSDEHQQGINWSSLGNSGFNMFQAPTGNSPLSTGATPGGVIPGLLTMTYSARPGDRSITAAVSLLESFGKVKVLSSPKLSVLNNQTALLKVVDNRVYFTVSVDIQPATATSAAVTTYTTTVNTVPIGFVMSVTPQIDENNVVTMNVRPTISRIIAFQQDPSPALAQAGVVSRIPEVQTRELESVIQVSSGQTAVMGGLMQDSVNNSTDGVPGLSRIPILGELFNYKNNLSQKTELVIFLRPQVITDASLNGDYRAFREHLPDARFLTKPSDTLQIKDTK